MIQIFIDESGTDRRDGRSVIALVYLGVDNLDRFERVVTAIEEALDIENFHWAHSSWEVRRKFIREISKHDFTLKVAFIRNPFRETVRYEYVLYELISEKDISRIVIDGKKGKPYERRMKKALGYKGVRIQKIKTGSDESYPGLRVADALAGLVRYRDGNPNDKKSEDIYRLISDKISMFIDI